MAISRAGSPATVVAVVQQSSAGVNSSALATKGVGGTSARISNRMFEVVEPPDETGCGCGHWCRRFFKSVRNFFSQLGHCCRGRRQRQTSVPKVLEGEVLERVMQQSPRLFFCSEMQEVVEATRKIKDQASRGNIGTDR